MTKKQQIAMQKGRERAIKAARKAAVKRVKDYNAWVRRDADIHSLRRRGKPAKYERMPAIPSDNDYDVARAEGAI